MLLYLVETVEAIGHFPGAVVHAPTGTRSVGHLRKRHRTPTTVSQAFDCFGGAKPTHVTLLWVELQSSAVAVRSAVPRQAGSPADRSPRFGAAGQKRWSSPRESPTRPQSIW